MSIKGIVDMIGAILGGAAVTVGTAGAGAAVGVTVSIAGVVIGTAELAYGAAVATTAWNNLLEDAGKLDGLKSGSGDSWGSGNFESIFKSQQYHYNEHGAEVGAKNFEDYLRKAEAYKKTILEKKIKSNTLVEGDTPNVFRYRYNGKYIDLQHIYNKWGTIIDYKIISYGAR